MAPVTGTLATLLTLPLPKSDASAQPRETAEVQRWLDQARAGDQAAFGALVDAHRRLVFRTAYAALGRREDAEDVSQEAFILAWRKLSGFRGDSTFRTWLVTITWRRALDRRRTRAAWWQRLMSARERTDPLEFLAGEAPSPEQGMLARDRAQRARQQIAHLTPTLRDTLLLAATGDYTYQEISAMLGTPVGTVKWRVSEARRILSARLDGE
jgi:RNA polymerase sigma-70 factor (ECF subfamily)